MTALLVAPTRLTVLYDADCALCTGFRHWLEGQPALVPLDLVPARSAQAHDRFPTLDHARTLREITVVSDEGQVWTREDAWIMALWGTASHRALAMRLATPAWRPFARSIAAGAAGLRHALSPPASRREGDAYSDAHAGDACAGEAWAGSCAPLPQG